MGKYSCEKCAKTFSQKSHYDKHLTRKNPCEIQTDKIKALIDKAVEEKLIELNKKLISNNTENNITINITEQMDISKMSKLELMEKCKELGITKSSSKNKGELIELINSKTHTKKKVETIIKDDGEIINSITLTPPVDFSPTTNVISLFSGMGGMDLGFSEQVIVHSESILTSDFIDSAYTTNGFVNLKRLPFKIVFQNDILPAAKKVAELNNWNHNYTLKDIRDYINDNYEFPSADVITGGFPCQDFSHAGKRKGFDADRGTLYQSYVEVVKRVKPIIFVAENVNGLLTMAGNPIQKIMDDFAAVGYEVKYQLIKCEDFGIPQTRHRVIIMGIRLDCRYKLKDDWNVITENKKKCAIKHYFMHLEEPDKSMDMAQQSYSKAAKLEKGQGQTEIKMDGFCPTMRAEHHGNIEFRRLNGGKNNEGHLPERRLSVREAALIQTFPPNCILTEKKPSSMAYKPIGNAVPPLLGYIIARKVQQILELCRAD
uniref:DNA (cytosine-5-)-methyltransferase n=1 Tax=viral metagenome TaxID=1070528 RepID=A0A6C0H288_9ZZZZ